MQKIHETIICLNTMLTSLLSKEIHYVSERTLTFEEQKEKRK